jgi:hypothetical protein
MLDINVEKKNTNASNISNLKNVNTRLIAINASIFIPLKSNTPKNKSD